jgi:hypothetical protein
MCSRQSSAKNKSVVHSTWNRWRTSRDVDKKDRKGPEQSVLKTGMCSCYGKLAERRFRGIDPETNNPVIPPHVCPQYASAITAHTRRELMKVALLAPECAIGFATDAIYLETLVPGIPRLKAEDDIKAGKEEKLLGDWCWAKVPAAVFIQSGLALYLDGEGKVAEVKCRGLPIKQKEKAQKFLDDVLEAWGPGHQGATLPSKSTLSCRCILQSFRQKNSTISFVSGGTLVRPYGLTIPAESAPSTIMSWIISDKRRSHQRRKKTLRRMFFLPFVSLTGLRMKSRKRSDKKLQLLNNYRLTPVGS